MAGKVPVGIIYTQGLGHNRILFYLYLFFYVGRNGKVMFNISHAVKEMGFKPNRNSGRINSSFRSFISSMVQRGYLEQVSHERYFDVCRCTHMMLNPGTYATVYYHEYEQILSSVSNPAYVLSVLAFIRINMYRRTDGGDKKPEIYYGHLNTIAKWVGFDEDTVRKCIDELCRLNIIRCEETNRFIDGEGNWHAGVSVFVDFCKYRNGYVDANYDWKREMDDGKKIARKNQIGNINL